MSILLKLCHVIQTFRTLGIAVYRRFAAVVSFGPFGDFVYFQL